MIYLDASALVPLVKREFWSHLVEAEIARAPSIIVSDFAIGEASSAIARLFRMGRMDRDLAADMLSKLDQWTASRASMIELSPVDTRLATLSVRSLAVPIRMPDALHLAISRRIGATLLTLDVGLHDAAVFHASKVQLISAPPSRSV